MGPAVCTVVVCYNSTKKLKKWKESNCKIHGVLIKDCVCFYNHPYRLFKFQSILRYGKKREKWIGLLRPNKDNITWKPCDSDTACKYHFADGESTVSHRYLELKVGYKEKILQARREMFQNVCLDS